VARQMPLNTQMGMGHDRFDPELGAWASEFRMSENNHRHFYRRGAELMEAAGGSAAARDARPEARHA
jgi:hypothetical protein